jgi:hypothetical protein
MDNNVKCSNENLREFSLFMYYCGMKMFLCYCVTPQAFSVYCLLKTIMVLEWALPLLGFTEAVHAEISSSLSS